MQASRALPFDYLRTFVLARDLGSFKGAARAVGRTEAAVSTQMRRLEEEAGVPLFRRGHRKPELNAAGEKLLTFARRLLALQEETLQALAGETLRGRVRLGLLQDFAESILPPTLASFVEANPGVETEVVVDRSSELLERLARRELDLVLVFQASGARPGLPFVRLGRLPMVWVRSADHAVRTPVPLVGLPSPCVFRDAAQKCLEGRLPWRQSFASPSLSGVWAAVAAGLGVTVRTPLGLPPSLVAVPRLAGSGALPRVEVALFGQAEEGAAVGGLRRVIEATLRARVGGGR